MLLPLLIALQIPFVVTAETQVPATRSCRTDVSAVPVAAAIAVVPQTIVVAVAMHHQDVVGDDDGVEGPIGGGANGKQAIVVDKTGSPAVLYSNAARITAWLSDLVDAVDPLAAALGR